MLDSLQASLAIASSGLEAQSTRMRIVSENLANANSTGRTSGSDPHQGKTGTFEVPLERAAGPHLVKIKELGVKLAPFRVDYDPGPPAADKGGFVKLPNLNMMNEM